MGVTEDPQQSSDQSGFITGLESFVKQVYPEYYSATLISANKQYLSEATTLFHNFTEIYEHQEQYNVQWAFKQASETLKIHTTQLTATFEETIPEYNDIMNAAQRRTRAHMQNVSQMVSFTGLVVNFATILASLMTIVFVYRINQMIGSRGGSILLNTLLIGIVAFVKVSWDRFVQIPRIEAFGWNRYAKAMEHVKEKAAQILAIQLVLQESIKRKESKEIQNQLFRKGIRQFEVNP